MSTWATEFATGKMPNDDSYLKSFPSTRFLTSTNSHNVTVSLICFGQPSQHAITIFEMVRSRLIKMVAVSLADDQGCDKKILFIRGGLTWPTSKAIDKCIKYAEDNKYSAIVLLGRQQSRMDSLKSKPNIRVFEMLSEPATFQRIFPYPPDDDTDKSFKRFPRSTACGSFDYFCQKLDSKRMGRVAYHLVPCFINVACGMDIVLSDHAAKDIVEAIMQRFTHYDPGTVMRVPGEGQQAKYTRQPGCLKEYLEKILVTELVTVSQQGAVVSKAQPEKAVSEDPGDNGPKRICLSGGSGIDQIEMPQQITSDEDADESQEEEDGDTDESHEDEDTDESQEDDDADTDESQEDEDDVSIYRYGSIAFFVLPGVALPCETVSAEIARRKALGQTLLVELRGADAATVEVWRSLDLVTFDRATGVMRYKDYQATYHYPTRYSMETRSTLRLGALETACSVLAKCGVFDNPELETEKVLDAVLNEQSARRVGHF